MTRISFDRQFPCAWIGAQDPNHSYTLSELPFRDPALGMEIFGFPVLEFRHLRSGCCKQLVRTSFLQHFRFVLNFRNECFLMYIFVAKFSYSPNSLLGTFLPFEFNQIVETNASSRDQNNNKKENQCSVVVVVFQIVTSTASLRLSLFNVFQIHPPYFSQTP